MRLKIILASGCIAATDYMMLLQDQLGELARDLIQIGTSLFSREPIHASGKELHPPAYPWPHRGYLSAFDHAR
jgi:hypothetical protein